MNRPLVSVIIPCYNHGQYLMECINSVKNQSYPRLEIIVVNDGSKDKFTNDLINNIVDPQIKVINKVNGGLAAARNTGIDNCSGEIILPLDADDYIATTYVEQAVDLLIADDNIGLVSCRGKYFGERNDVADNAYISFRSMLLYNALFNCAVFRKEDFEYIGKYNINMNKGYEDWDFYIRMINYKEKIIQLPDILFFYRQKSGSMLDELEKNKGSREEMENTLFKNNIDIYIDEWGSMIAVLKEYELLKSANNSIQIAVNKVHNTLSYRLGNLVLSPFKFIRKLSNK